MTRAERETFAEFNRKIRRQYGLKALKELSKTNWYVDSVLSHIPRSADELDTLMISGCVKDLSVKTEVGELTCEEDEEAKKTVAKYIDK